MNKLFLILLMGILALNCASALSFSDYFTELKETEVGIFDAYSVFTLHNPTANNLVLDSDKLDAYFNEVSNGISEWKYFLEIPVEYERQLWIPDVSCEELTGENGTYESCEDNGHYEPYLETIYEFHEFNGTYFILPDESIDVKIYGKFEKSALDNPVMIDWIAEVKDNTGFFGIFYDTYESENWAWWNSSFSYYKTLTNLTGNFTYMNLTYDAHYNTDFSDIFFVQNDSVVLNATIQNKTNSQWAIFRVFNPNQTDVKIYYGNNSAIGSNSNANFTHLIPISAYYMDEKAGNVILDSVGSNNGTNNMASINQAGQIDTGYKFDGTDDYANISGIETSLNGSTAVTISLWFNGNEFSGDDTLIGDGIAGDGTNNYYLRFHSASELQQSGSIGICTNATWWHDIDGGTTFSTGTWYHLAMVINTTGKYVFINGVWKATTTCTATSYYKSGDTPTMLGIRKYGATLIDGYFNGTIDSLFFYNRSLTPIEIMQLYTYTSPAYVLGGETSSNSISFTSQSPSNNSIITASGNVNLNFTAVSPQSSSMNCTLYINGSANATNTASNNTLLNFAVAVPNGTAVSWNATCQNGTASNSTGTYYFSTNWATSYSVETIDENTSIEITYSPVVAIGENAEISVTIHASENYTDFNWSYHGKGMITDSAFSGTGIFMTTGGASISDANGCTGFCLMSGDYEGDYEYTGDEMRTFEFREKPKDPTKDTCADLGGCECASGGGYFCSIPCGCVADEPRPTPSEPIDETPPDSESIWKDTTYTFYVKFNNEGYYPFYVTASGIDNLNNTLLLYSNGGKIIVGDASTYINGTASATEESFGITSIVVYGFLIAFIIGSALMFMRRN